MSIDEYDYRYNVCPHCKSKKLSAVAVVRLEKGNYYLELSRVNRTGYLCGNRGRYSLEREIKRITDRAEMRRDMNRLKKILEKVTK